MSDGGTYAVHAGSGSGQSTSQCKVDVISTLPSFKEGLADQTVRAGHPVVFSAVVHGVPRPRVRWFFGGVEVVDSTERFRISYSEDGRAELMVVAVSLSDVGLSCECRASSEVGEAVSVASLVPGWCCRSPAEPACSIHTSRIMG